MLNKNFVDSTMKIYVAMVARAAVEILRNISSVTSIGPHHPSATQFNIMKAVLCSLLLAALTCG